MPPVIGQGSNSSPVRAKLAAPPLLLAMGATLGGKLWINSGKLKSISGQPHGVAPTWGELENCGENNLTVGQGGSLICL